MIQAVLCDIDGTLVDSNSLHARCWVEAFAEFDIALEEDDVLHQIGKGGGELIAHYLTKERAAEVEEPLKTFRKKLFEMKYMGLVKPFPCVRELLATMRTGGLRVAIASSTDKDHLDYLKNIANIEDLVEKDATSADAKKAKPHPDIFQAAMQQLKLESAECIALGDTPWDVQAARKAGVHTVAVTSGGWSKPELVESGAISVYEDAADLLANFSESVFAKRRASAQATS